MDPRPRPLAPCLAARVAELPEGGALEVGPLVVPVAWLRDPEHYRRDVRRAAEAALARSLPSRDRRPTAPPEYVPKVLAELEPLLALAPDVLLVPTDARLTMEDLIRLRAWPVHPLGVVADATPADGAVRSPAEFFFHDLDHARFKVREDLLARGIAIPDPYVDGSTFDADLGAHRAVMTAALPHVDGDGWRRGPDRAAYVARVLAALDARPEPASRESARWLLFELVHEKSLPLEPAALSRALATATHVAKLRAKCARGFYRSFGPSPDALAGLEDARARLLGAVEAAG